MASLKKSSSDDADIEAVKQPAASRVRIRSIALPTEHGGWGFTLEPILLGLLVAPSAAAWEISAAALGIFLARRGNLGLVLGLILALGGGAWTYARAEAWTSSEKLWAQMLDDAPESAKAHFYAGLDFEYSGLFGTAAAKYKKALELCPSYARAELRLASVLEQDLKYVEAVDHYVRALEIQLEDQGWTYVSEPYGTAGGPAELITQITQLRVYNEAVDQVQEHLDWADS